MPEGFSALELKVKLEAMQAQLDDVTAKLDHLTVLADQAAEFLHDPIGRYKRRRLGTLKAGGDGTPA